jgi:uncharacterized protein (TIGR02246 family)
MEKTTTETELLNLEKKYWQAIKDKNVDAALSLTDVPCLVAGASGAALIGRESFVKMMKDARYTLNGFELKKAEVKLLGDDVAGLVYEVHEELTVDGRKVSLDASDSSVWVRRDGRWLCALHSESLKGDPFGRDRKGATSH